MTPEEYAKELAEAIRPFIESARKLRFTIKSNIDSRNKLNWKNVEQIFYKFEDELNKFLGEE